MTADAPSSVTKALRLLAHLAVAKEPVALADISRSLKLPKPTTYRLARSIEDAGFVHKDPLTRRYHLGAAFEEIALNALRHGAGRTRRRLLMNALAEKLGARVNLVVLKAGNISFVHWVELMTPLRVDLAKDEGMPVHCSASGKLLLAFGSEELRCHVLRSTAYRAYTKKTITTARALARELDKIRKRGFAEDDQEYFSGVNCLAVPVYNRQYEVVAGLAVMAPTASLPLKTMRAHIAAIRACAAAISKELGWEATAPRKNTRKPPRVANARRGLQRRPAGKRAL